jgi:superoxide dismutase, Fe-Mn family
MTYTVKEDIKPQGLNGISDEQIADHWNLYVAYVNQSNALKNDLAAMRSEGSSSSLAYADRRRRFGFEFAGMTLHEFYFANLKANVTLAEDSKFVEAVKASFGSLEAWKEDFTNTGKTRSIGWAICFMDPETGDINNHFVQLHEEGNIPSFHPLVVMDVWEHAYMVDHKAGGRPAYITNVMSNINWDIVEQRYEDAKNKLASSRA